MQPVQHFSDAVNLSAHWQSGTVNHQDLEAQLPRRNQLGSRAIAAGIFADDQINAVLPEKCDIVFHSERPPVYHHRAVRKRQCVFGRIHQPQQIMVLRLRRERLKLHATDCQHHFAGWPGQRIHSRLNIRHSLPAISFNGFPVRTGQSKQRNTGVLSRHHRVATHLSGKGVSGVNQVSKVLNAKKIRQSVSAPETAGANSNGLFFRRLNTSGVAVKRIDIAGSQSFGQRIGFCGATKDQDFYHG